MEKKNTASYLVKLSAIFQVLGHKPPDDDYDVPLGWVEYTDTGITIIDTADIPHPNPRLAFAKVLTLFREKMGYNTVKGGGLGLYNTIGGNGFGYVWNGEQHIEMPHLGSVVIMDNVILHNHINIDRGVTTDTIIHKGCRIDSFVHIAHGAVIGENTLIASHAVIGGSVKIGSNCFIGIGVTIKQKVKVGNNCIVGAGAVVINDVPDNWVIAGNPAKQLNMNK